MGELRFMISEAAKRVNVETHVLRYWEEELDISIDRTEMGHRYYTEDDIQLFCCIKKLKDEGMPLKELKGIIPELMNTKARMSKVKEEKATVGKPAVSEAAAQDTGKSESAGDTTLTVAQSEIITEDKLKQVRCLLGDVLTEVVTTNNETLKKDISKTVTSDVMKEMDFLFQAKERREEEHFRKLDCLIRQQQANRRDSAKTNPLGKLKKLLT